jgi:hypothetical protein
MYLPRLANGRLSKIPEDQADVGSTLVHTKRISYGGIEPAIKDLRSARFQRFKSNFIHVRTGNARGPMNWFDDQWWQIICHNIGMIAKAAKQGGCRGILIDPEVYSYSWWHYPTLAEKRKTDDYRRGRKEFYAGKSFEDVAAKVRQRGQQFAGALNGEFPDPVIMFFHAAGYTAWQCGDRLNKPVDPSELRQAGMGLMVPFLDGILEGSTDQTIIVDATSQAKWWTQRRQLETGRRHVKEDALMLSQVPQLYRRKVKVGFCYRLDYHPQEEKLQGYNRVGGLFDPAVPAANFFSPEKLEETLKLALEVGDGYVLFWNARANWWLDSVDARPLDGAPLSDFSRWVPRAYWAALNNARAAFE